MFPQKYQNQNHSHEWNRFDLIEVEEVKGQGSRVKVEVELVKSKSSQVKSSRSLHLPSAVGLGLQKAEGRSL